MGERAKAGHVAVDVLARAGVRRFYTVPGESFLEILDAAERHPETSLVSTRHESGASFMAEAEAKVTGMPAVAMATRGVGASNLAIGVHTAMQDSTPMVVLLGQVETDYLDREAFQEVDLPAFYGPITKWATTVHRADRLPELVARAVRVATSGRPGPVMLALPADILGEEIEERGSRLSAGRPRSVPHPEDVEDVARRLAGARRPVLIAGGGARHARDALVRFAEAFGCGVYAAFRRQDVFPNEHPLYLGHLTLAARPEVLESLGEADLVVVVGSRLGEITTQTYGLPRGDQAVVQVDTDPDEVGATVPVERGIVSDAGAALEAFTRRAPAKAIERDWTAAHEAYLRFSEVPVGRSEAGVDPAEVVGALRRVLPAGAVLANDAGNFSVFLHRYWRHNHPRTQVAAANGAMGYGVPGAVGAKIASPQSTVVALCGDGGFLMTGQEIETAVRYGVGITVVVFRNGLHGTIAMHQARDVGRTAGSDIGPVDLAGFARSLGAEGFTVADPDDLEPALRDAVAHEGVSLVDVATDPDLISPTARLSELAPEGTP
jgi:acetolactate synthase I/II/III large subunit